MQVNQIRSLTQVHAGDWNRLADPKYPFLRHEFLAALELSGSVSSQTGWQAAHLIVEKQHRPVAILPLYLKTHSWGEYVFDQQWAEAYRQSGLEYYPKYLSAVPFTPCQGPRLLIEAGIDSDRVMRLLFDFIRESAETTGISSWHCLFPVSPHLEQLQSLNLSVREGVQFQWLNRGYRDFDDYLDSMSSGKRKMVRSERRKVTEQGIRMLRVAGPEVSESQWEAFYRFYAMTYLKRRSQPYLNRDFFRRIAADMPERCLLILAVKDGDYIGAALSFVGNETLYGRYWGCYEEYNSLHFEACYYQGLDYCLDHGLMRFDSGAQGEHKIARGFEPVTTYSTHWIKDSRFALAVADFVKREQKAIQHYKRESASYLPFKQTHISGTD